MEKTDKQLADFIGKRKWTKSQLSDGREQQWDLPMCDGYFPTLKTMKFTTSWDWLMPVVQKITNLETRYINDKEDDTFTSLQYGVAASSIGYVGINSVYDSCVKFIKFYNSQKGETTE